MHNLTAITDEASLEVALQALIKLDWRFGPLLARSGPVPLRARPSSLATLCEIVSSQVVTRQVADTLWARLMERVDPDDASQILAADDGIFLGAGLTRGKMTAMRGLAAAIQNGSLNLGALPTLPARDALSQLTSVKGIGPWTGQIYLLFSVGHLDVFPAGDVALQSMLRGFLNLEERPKAKEAAELAAQWAPLRGAAARALYAAYGAKRAGAGQPI